MTDRVNEEARDAALRAHLESDVLRLPEPVFYSNVDRYYDVALRTHAVPVVNRLVELLDAGVERVNPTLAEYDSNRVDRVLLYARSWRDSVDLAVGDLARAAGINIATDSRNNSEYQLAWNLKRALGKLELPSALQRRIESRKDKLLPELDDAIKADNGYLKEIDKPSVRGVPIIGNIMDHFDRRRRIRDQAAFNPVFRLRVGFDFDRSEIPNFGRPSYTRLKHTISLAPSPTLA